MVTLFQTLHTLSHVVVHHVDDRLAALKNDEKGASAVEYAILVGILAAIIVTAVGLFGDKLASAFGGISFK